VNADDSLSPNARNGGVEAMQRVVDQRRRRLMQLDRAIARRERLFAQALDRRTAPHIMQNYERIIANLKFTRAHVRDALAEARQRVRVAVEERRRENEGRKEEFARSVKVDSPYRGEA
jgi:flagellar biosynthesis chaperone FliJ